MFVITIIGASKQGKTPFIRNYCNGKNVLIFDVQNEYGQKTKYIGQTPYGLSSNTKLPRSRFIEINADKFIKLCGTKQKTVCVFEEATMFFQGMTGEEMRRLLFSKAFSQNVYLLVFHSINSVPPRIMEATDYVILFKTNDVPKTVERKFPKLFEPFNILQKSKDGVHIKIKMI